MAGLDRVIDPVSRDYVTDGAGGWVYTRTLATAIYHQYQDELDRWVGDPDAGSEFYLLKREDNTPATRLRAEDYARRAAKPFVDEGLATQLAVSATATGTNRAELRSSIHDVQAGEDVETVLLLPWGV